MTNQHGLSFGLSLSVMLLCGCGPETSKPAATTDNDGQVTFVVKGMTERLSIY